MEDVLFTVFVYVCVDADVDVYVHVYVYVFVFVCVCVYVYDLPQWFSCFCYISDKYIDVFLF